MSVAAPAPPTQEGYIRAFSRYELKYLLHYTQARELLAAMAPHVRMDENRGDDGFYKIASLYYDSQDLACYWEKIDGEKWRRKVRVRTYGARPEDAFVEIKQRYNLTVQKRRCRVPLAEAEEIMADICAGRYRPGLDPVFDEVFVLARRYRLEPKLIVSYQRAAFFDNYKSDLRITMDRNIKCRNLGLDLARDRTAGRWAVPPETILLEVKFNEVIPRWLCQVLNRFDLQITRISKYCAGIERARMQESRSSAHASRPRIVSTEPPRPPATPKSAAGEGLRVRECSDVERDNWDRFVRAHPRATFFHQWGWRNVLHETFRYEPRYLVATREGRLCGALPLFLCRTIKGARGLYSLPHTVYGGPVGDEEAERALLARARQIGRDAGARTLEFRNRHANTLDVAPLDGFVTFEKELPEDPALVYKSFPKKAREALNQARKKHALAADFAGDLDTFYGLLAESYRGLGTPVFPRRFFAAMLREFPDDGQILLVKHEGRAVAGVLSMAFRDTMMPLYSGEAPGVAKLRSSNFKYFRLQEWAVEHGLRRFDFGRSRADNPGVVKFKTNQGFEAEPLPYQIESLHGAAPAESGSPNQGIFAKARRVWRKLPPVVARTLGPAVVRYFP